jgi:hypothetical protein
LNEAISSKSGSEFTGGGRQCWGLVLKCYELRTRQHKMLNDIDLRPLKHYSFEDNGSWTKVDKSFITKSSLRNKLSINIVR